jgi:hypothetical protein
LGIRKAQNPPQPNLERRMIGRNIPMHHVQLDAQ